MTQVTSGECVSCGAPRAEKFCARCGEKRISTHDYSILHFGENFLETLTHFDIRSLRALRVLVTRPGELTRAYLGGRRKMYVGPIQLFVIINVVFALLGANTFRTPLAAQRQSWMPELKARMLARAQEKANISDEEFEHEFDRTAGTQAKTWVFTMIPAYALTLTVLYGFRRYFFEHLVFATHFMAFVLIWIIVGGFPMNVALRAAGANGAARDQLVSLWLVIGMFVYLLIALRRSYGDRWYAAAPRAFVMVIAFVPMLRVYRLLLFFVTLYAMH